MIYDAIFFDWDGTAVTSRTAPADEVLNKMKVLLSQNVKLFVISGTTYEKLAGGKMHDLLECFSEENLYLGLGRGVHNIGFQNRKPVMLADNTPTAEEKLRIDRAAFEVHCYLYQKFGLPTDIVFTRPNYCKVDVLVELDRGNHLFLQASEIDQVNHHLKHYGIKNGLLELIQLSDSLGEAEGLKIVTTTDAKYLEIGLTTKSDNVNYFMESVLDPLNIPAENCAFFGDEFTYLAEGIRGSDSFMMTEKTKRGHFFDVSLEHLNLPERVTYLGGGVPRFLAFLEEQIEERKRL